MIVCNSSQPIMTNTENETLKLNATKGEKKPKYVTLNSQLGHGWYGNRYWRLDYLRALLSHGKIFSTLVACDNLEDDTLSA